MPRQPRLDAFPYYVRNLRLAPCTTSCSAGSQKPSRGRRRNKFTSSTTHYVDCPPGLPYPEDTVLPSPIRVLFIGVAPPENGRHFHTDPSDNLRRGLLAVLEDLGRPCIDVHGFLARGFFLVHARPGWGKMTAQQMVEHLAWAFELSTGQAHGECPVCGMWQVLSPYSGLPEGGVARP